MALQRAAIVKISSIPGYILSSVFLTAAILIFALVKRLHCTRNLLHLHLFCAFLLRCCMCLLVAFDLNIQSNTPLGRFGCRVYATVFNYSIISGWIWLLAVGLYMFNVIHRTVFGTQRLVYYVTLGWGGSGVCLLPWIIVKLINDNGCWLQTGPIIVWLQRGPQLIVIIINLCLFFIMTCDIYKKLRDTHIPDTKRLLTLARSSLILLIVFGVPYCITSPLNIFLVNPIEPEGVRDWIIMGIEHFLGSIMGFFIAIIFCFNNSEVRAELRRVIGKWHSHTGPKKVKRRRSTASSTKGCHCQGHKRSRSRDSFTRLQQDDTSLTTQTYIFRHKGIEIAATVPVNMNEFDVETAALRKFSELSDISAGSSGSRRHHSLGHHPSSSRPRRPSKKGSHKRKPSTSSRRSSNNSKTVTTSMSNSATCYLCDKDDDQTHSGLHTACTTVANSAQSTLSKQGTSVRFSMDEATKTRKSTTSTGSSASNLSSEWNESLADVSL